MKVNLYQINAGVLFCLLLGSCSNQSNTNRGYQHKARAVPSYCEVVSHSTSVHEGSVCLSVVAHDKYGKHYTGEVFFKGDIGAGYIGINKKDSIYIDVKCSIYQGYTALDLQGNVYQVYLQKQDGL